MEEKSALLQKFGVRINYPFNLVTWFFYRFSTTTFLWCTFSYRCWWWWYQFMNIKRSLSLPAVFPLTVLSSNVFFNHGKVLLLKGHSLKPGQVFFPCAIERFFCWKTINELFEGWPDWAYRHLLRLSPSLNHRNGFLFLVRSFLKKNSIVTGGHSLSREQSMIHGLAIQI